ncbi:MAG: TOBE domain-containing protein, partial [Pyrinomonadaceae bacterium]
FHDGTDAKGFKQMFGYFAGGISSGERQFDKFEAAIANAGRVLLLDDPFSQMDTALRDACFAAIRKAAKQRNRVVIFATSDFDQIMGLTDEVAFMSGGEIRQSGTPQDIYDNPATIEAARMTGENNLIVARRLTSSDDDLPEFHTIDGEHRLFAHRADKKRLGPINQNMTLAIRPELVSMTPGVTRPEDNLLRAVVKAVHFRGSTSIVEFDADGLAIKTCVLKSPALKPGDECMLGLPPHRILILKD